MHWKALATIAPTAISAALYLTIHSAFALSMLRRGRRRDDPGEVRAPLPLVSILKPLAGLDDELVDNLASFAHLDYPRHEILFGVASPADPAVKAVQAFSKAHPGVASRLVITDPGAAQNPKVAQLIELTRQARGSVLVVSDANVRVTPGYLRSLLGVLLQPGVGLCSSVIAGTGERSFGAMIENAHLAAGIAPAVVAAASIADRPITVGKSMAMRRADLEAVGGWESVGGVLAEDDVLGQRFNARGYVVAHCLAPVENRNTTCSLSRTLERHSRWGKMRRAIAPRCFALEPLLLPAAVAWLVALIAPSALALSAWLSACLLQVLGAFVALSLLRPGERNLRLAALEPARAAVVLACWALAYASRRVSWRGNAFHVAVGSELIPVVDGDAPALEPPAT
ncbi:MAG TPA: glycosyltransferase [Candidatus Nanopelagicales bacterium]|nr:glycosyltransferase [Candidatus Nanopelagicales bacterium]